MLPLAVYILLNRLVDHILILNIFDIQRLSSFIFDVHYVVECPAGSSNYK